MFDQLCLFDYLTETDEDHPHECRESVKPATLESSQESADDSTSCQIIESPVASHPALVNVQLPSRLSGIATVDSTQSIIESQVAIVRSGSDETERIFHLEQALDQALQYLDELRARVKHQTALEEQVALTEDYAYVQYQAIARLKADLEDHKEIIKHRERSITALESDKNLAQTNLLSLQQDQLSLRQENAQWKNACQELQQECDRQHRKMLNLEEENAAMQEQILQQARQANEHETAVQYWKDQFNTLQQYVSQIKQAIDLNLSGGAEKGQSVINAMQLRELLNTFIPKDELEHTGDADTAGTSNRYIYNVPDFLIRRYRYRSVESSKPEPDQS